MIHVETCRDGIIMNIILIMALWKNKHQPFPTTNDDDFLETVLCCKGYSLQSYLTNPTMYNTNIPQCTILWQKYAHMYAFQLQIGELSGTKLVHCTICEKSIYDYMVSFPQ